MDKLDKMIDDLQMPDYIKDWLKSPARRAAFKDISYDFNAKPRPPMKLKKFGEWRKPTR